MTACQNTPKTPALDMANFDLSVAPNADFYEYATGGWQKNNPLKPEYARYGSFDILRDNNEKRINELFNLDNVLKGVYAEASDGCDEGRPKETILKYKEDYRAHVI